MKKEVSRRAVLIAAIICALAACGREEKISPSYTPLTGVAIVPGADRVSLDVVSQDNRATLKDRVGTVKQPWMRVVADNDVAALVRGAIARGLKDQGFVLAAGGLIVTVELQNFYGDYSLGADASVAFTLRVRDSIGRTLYTRYYEGSGKAGLGLIFQAADRIKTALEQATGNAVKQAMDDKALQRALLSAR